MERQLVVGFVCLELKDGSLGTQNTTVLGESWLKPDFGFKFQGSGFKIQGSGFKIQVSSLFQSLTLSYPLACPFQAPCYDFGDSGLMPVSRFKFQDSSFRAQRAGFKFQDSCFKIQDSRFKIQVSRFKFQDSSFKIQDSGFRVQVLQASDLTSLQRGDELGY